MLDHMKCVSSIAYNIAEHNKPYTDNAGLLALVYKLGAEVRSEYNNDMRCAEFVPHTVEVLRKDLICELQKHKYVSLLDASTDKADAEHLILYVRYITDKVEFFYRSSPSSVLLQMEIFRLFNRNWKSLDSIGFIFVNLLEWVQMEQPA
jgi:hypothetical protein